MRRTQASLAALTRAAAEEGTVFAGAVGGGFVFPSFLPAYDAMASLANLLELLAPVERPLSELVAELPRSTLVHREVRCPWALKGTLMRVLTERNKGRRPTSSTASRSSRSTAGRRSCRIPNEPLVHIYAEGDTQRRRAASRRELRELVEEIIAGEERGRGRHCAETLKWRLKDRLDLLH